MNATRIHAHPGRKLGARPPVAHRMATAIPFAEHLAVVPQHPISVDDTTRIRFGMDGNDKAGDCVVAGRDHARQVWTHLLTGHTRTMTWPQIVGDYRTQNPGYDPHLAEDDPHQQDGGMVIEEYLALLRHRGDITGYALVDHANEEMVKAATYLDLALIGGFDLQVAQQDQVLWDVAPRSPAWGGHCAVVAKYQGKPDQFGLITWGEVVPCTWRFIEKRCSELWFVVTTDHLQHPGFRKGFDADSFARAVAAVTGKPFSG